MGRASEPDDDAERLTAALEAARGGDETAFRHLYRALQPGLLRYLHGLIGADAEDVASEAWLQVARDLHTFVGDYPQFRRWVTTIGRHRAIDHARYHRRRPQEPVPVEDLAFLPGPSDTATSAAETFDTYAAIRLIALLPPDQAEAVLLRVVVGLDAAETGRVLGKSPGAVRTAAHRGLRRLAHLLRRPA